MAVGCIRRRSAGARSFVELRGSDSAERESRKPAIGDVAARLFPGRIRFVPGRLSLVGSSLVIRYGTF